jgi:uncharacterized protein (UPF0276 family)
VHTAVSWMADARLVEAAQPLIDDGTLTALSVTLEHAARPLPEALTAPLDALAGALVGHGVHLSPATRWDAVSTDWLRRARQTVDRYPVRWVTEHHGVLRGGRLHAAPLPLPPSSAYDQAAVSALARVREALEVPVGLENLALASSADDGKRQLDRLAAIVEAVDGLVLLDVHNLWCQANNYGLDPVALARRLPLDRVREVHVAGGSWSDWPEGRFRRDTHDGPVPEPVWMLLDTLLPELTALEVATLERMPSTLDSPEAVAAWRAEVRRLAAVSPPQLQPTARRPTHPGSAPRTTDPVAADALVAFQRGGEPSDIRAAAGAAQAWLSGWDPRALRTAADVVGRYARPLPASTTT